MATALWGGAVLQAVFAVLFERLTPHNTQFLNYIRAKKLDNNLIHRLKPSLNAARSVLNDAELKQFKDPAVRDWLDELRDAAYQVEDFMDDISTIVDTQNKVCNFFSASLTVRDTDMANKLEAITAKLEFIVAQKDLLGLKTSLEPKNLSQRTQSTSRVKVSDVCGRGKEKDDIIKLMSDNKDKLSVIPIVGMGGIGKTTLAQLVYNGDYVKQNFDIKAWVCVSEAFDHVRITQTILRSIDRGHAFDNMDLNLLQLDLEEKLSKKKFLIVLDDVWNDKYTKWETLMIPFLEGLEGSKIVVTTRNEKIASMVKTIPTPYRLGLLSDGECLSLFARHAVRSSDPSLSSWVENFGGDIVSKCRGLPLAAKALGGLFRSKPDLQHWNNILKNEIWDSLEDAMVPALRVSYDYLPSHLKRCIVYCSLFPKDYKFDKEDLILMWMAEGFVQAPNRGMMTLEEVGYDYFDDLTARSFFQPCIEHGRHFVMHDLFHDLTILVGRDFFFRLEKEGDGNKIGSRARHMSFINLNFPSAGDIESLKGAKALRTIIGFDSEWLPRSIGKTIMSLDLRYLRVLSFRKFRALKVLPDSVVEFLHLRYLDLSYTAIESLPNSVCKLYNLQTLKLNGCYNLKMLPDDMQDLVNLRCLQIWGTSLEEMPRGMGKLKKLRILDKFVVGKEEGNMIQELEQIEDLTGFFQICKLENIKNCDEAQKAKMMIKKKINSLSLCWSHDDCCIKESKTENDIIDKLQPHQDLKSLTIGYYKGTMFPNWLGHVSYHNMTWLQLQDCKICWKLPPLGQLPALRHLGIDNLEKVVSISAEFYKGDDCASPVIPFASLEYLRIGNMAAWERWHSIEVEAFPKLQSLYIDGCPKLIGDLPCQLLSLNSLEINECPLLASSIPKCPEIQSLGISSVKNVVFEDDELPPSLCTLWISGDGMLESVLEAMAHSTIPNLKELHLRDCSKAMSLPVTCLPSSVKKLYIYDCKHVEFPQQQCHVSLETLCINASCDALTSLPSIEIFPHLKSLSIVRCENLISVLASNTPPPQNLQSIYIRGCKKLKRLCDDDSTICILPNLKSLEIIDCAELVEAFPTEIFPHLNSLSVLGCENLISVLASSSNTTPLQHLQSLSIEGCKNVKRLCDDDSTECTLPNLNSLSIMNCDEFLAHHREWHLPSSLTSLSIYDKNGIIKCFPAEGCFLPATLTTLHLRRFSNLEKLNCEGLQHLTSLHEFKISGCLKLEKFTGQMLPTSLTKLIIEDCDLLEERCRNKNDEIWPKISHIPAIRLTREWIKFDTTFHNHTHRSK